MTYFKAVILAVVEGVTEFLPISSTGHLILVEELLTFTDDHAFNVAFMVIIQLPAILSVVVYFWNDLWPFQQTADERRKKFVLWSKIVLAVLPAVFFGVMLNDVIEGYLAFPVPVALALFIGGVVLILAERRSEQGPITDVQDISYPAALFIGLFQCLAMVPGTSRSAATIIGAMLLGARRPIAAEFSFFLAIPTMLGAAVYKTLDYGLAFTAEQWGLLAVGSAVSFLIAYASIAFLMRFIQNHRFTVFGVYRMILACIVLLYFYVVA